MSRSIRENGIPHPNSGILPHNWQPSDTLISELKRDLTNFDHFVSEAYDGMLSVITDENSKLFIIAMLKELPDTDFQIIEYKIDFLRQYEHTYTDADHSEKYIRPGHASQILSAIETAIAYDKERRRGKQLIARINQKFLPPDKEVAAFIDVITKQLTLQHASYADPRVEPDDIKKAIMNVLRQLPNDDLAILKAQTNTLTNKDIVIFNQALEATETQKQHEPVDRRKEEEEEEKDKFAQHAVEKFFRQLSILEMFDNITFLPKDIKSFRIDSKIKEGTGESIDTLLKKLTHLNEIVLENSASIKRQSSELIATLCHAVEKKLNEYSQFFSAAEITTPNELITAEQHYLPLMKKWHEEILRAMHQNLVPKKRPQFEEATDTFCEIYYNCIHDLVNYDKNRVFIEGREEFLKIFSDLASRLTQGNRAQN